MKLVRLGFLLLLLFVVAPLIALDASANGRAGHGGSTVSLAPIVDDAPTFTETSFQFPTPTVVLVEVSTTTKTTTSIVFSERTLTTTTTSVYSVSVTQTLTETTTETSTAGIVPGFGPSLNIPILILGVIVGAIAASIISKVGRVKRPGKPSKPMERHCGACGKPAPGDVCSGCQHPTVQCTCSSKLKAGERYCARCGLFKIVGTNCAGCGKAEEECVCLNYRVASPDPMKGLNITKGCTPDRGVT